MSEQILENQRVRFKIHRKPQCIVEYEVEASAPLIQDAQKKALREVGKNVVVPGFRKGRAPLEIVAKRYPGELDRTWQQEIADMAYRECAALSKISPLRPDTTINFKMKNHSLESAQFILSFEAAPVVPSVDVSKFEFKPVPEQEITPEKVAEAIRQIRFFFGKWNQIEDRPVQEGDFILADIYDLEQETPVQVFSGVRFEVTPEKMAAWMRDLVIGKNIGENSDGVSVPDDNATEEEKKEFKAKKVRVIVRSIQSVELPPIDDQLAKQLGANTVQEMESRIQTILHNIANQGAKDAEREQVTEFLASIAFDLPRSVIEREAQFRMQQASKDPSFEREWKSATEQRRRDIVADYLRQSERAVRVFYLCRQISTEQKINISAKDIQQLPQDPLEIMLNPTAHLHDPREPEIKQAEAFSRLLMEKTSDWVLSQVASNKSS